MTTIQIIGEGTFRFACTSKINFIVKFHIMYLELFSGKKPKSANKEEDKLRISGSCGSSDGGKEKRSNSPRHTPRSLSVRRGVESICIGCCSRCKALLISYSTLTSGGAQFAPEQSDGVKFLELNKILWFFNSDF